MCEALYTIDSYPCDPNAQRKGGRGVTTWKRNEPFTIPAGSGGTFHSASTHFTCTFPRYYGHDDNCNLTFEAHAIQNMSSLTQDVHLGFGLNSYPVYEDAGGFYLSGAAECGGTQTTEFVNYGLQNYSEMGENTFTFTNWSTVDVVISNLKIMRVYNSEYLDYNSNPAWGYADSPRNGTFDNTRIDKPCNYEGCGGLSYSFIWDATNADKTIPPSGTMTWTLDWSNCGSSNYLQKERCLFNFNQMYAESTDPNHAYVKLDAYLNGYSITSYYLSNLGPDTVGTTVYNHAFFPSYDLTLNNHYNDLGANTVSLVNRGSVGVRTTPAVDGINIYRIYATESVCDYPCSECEGCENCYFGENCPICVGFCLTCVTPCQLCESGYDWNNMYGFNWPCTPQCETCYLPCYSCQPCETCQPCLDCQACEYACQGCEITCEVCQPCENCQSGCLTCEPGCYDCQSCYNCEPSCYDFQICYLCQENCYDCETCYNLQ
jgi:hypothetical protein